MKKADSLRAALVAAFPEFAADPDRLLVFIKAGKNIPAAKGSLSWKYDYTLNLIVLDYTGESDDLMLPILKWAEINQPDLFTDPARREDGFTFEAELTGNKTADIDISLRLSERVGVIRVDDVIQSVTHLDEPVIKEETGVNLQELFGNNELVS